MHAVLITCLLPKRGSFQDTIQFRSDFPATIKTIKINNNNPFNYTFVFVESSNEKRNGPYEFKRTLQ